MRTPPMSLRDVLGEYAADRPRHLDRIHPEKRRVHVCETTHGAVVALYSDGTWAYLWTPGEKEYR